MNYGRYSYSTSKFSALKHLTFRYMLVWLRNSSHIPLPAYIPTYYLASSLALAKPSCRICFYINFAPIDCSIITLTVGNELIHYELVILMCVGMEDLFVNYAAVIVANSGFVRVLIALEFCSIYMAFVFCTYRQTHLFSHYHCSHNIYNKNVFNHQSVH